MNEQNQFNSTINDIMCAILYIMCAILYTFKHYGLYKLIQIDLTAKYVHNRDVKA